jgi:predicted small secreted protein
MRKFMLFLAGAAALAVAACNTVEGAGRDVSAAGEAVSETAQDVKTGN